MVTKDSEKRARQRARAKKKDQQFDALVKRIVSHRQVLGLIVQGVVPEFQNYDYKTVQNCIAPVTSNEEIYPQTIQGGEYGKCDFR